MNKIEWKEVEFQDIADKKHPYPIGDGDHGKITPSMYLDSGVPYIRVGDMVDDKISFEKLIYIPEAVHQANIGKELVPEDLIIAKTGATIGKVAIIPKEIKRANTTSSVGKITLNKEIALPKYALYFMKTGRFTKQMWAVSIKSAQPGFNINDLKKFNIVLPFSNGIPDLKEQERIVKILENAEKLKQKSKKARELLDEYLKSVFNEMFYNKGFEIKQGKEIFELAYGKGLSAEERVNGKYPVYGSNGVVGSHSEYLIKGPGIIIGRKGSIGEVNFSKSNFWPIDTTYYIKTLKDVNFTYLFYLLKSHNLKINSSTAIPGLNRNKVYSMKFIDPPLPLQQKFAKIVEHVEKMKEKIKSEEQKSEELFNSLMQKAFRGEL